MLNNSGIHVVVCFLYDQCSRAKRVFGKFNSSTALVMCYEELFSKNLSYSRIQGIFLSPRHKLSPAYPATFRTQQNYLKLHSKQM